jgi:hypothetical protein
MPESNLLLEGYRIGKAMWDGGGTFSSFYRPSQELWIGWEEKENSGRLDVGNELQ